MQIYSTLNSEVIHKNPYWEYKKDIYIIPNGKSCDYFYVNSPGSVTIIAKYDNKFVLVKQARYLNQRDSIELPGGGIQKNTDVISAAKQEFEEETGYCAEHYEIIGKFNPYIGVTNEYCFVVLAEGLSKLANKKAHDETEEFELLFLDEKEIVGYINDEQIWNGQTLAAWTIYKLKKE